MSKDFRTTASAGGASHRVPRVRLADDVAVVDEEWIRYSTLGDLAELQDEFYLRVLKDYDADSSLDEIADLVRTYGQLCLDDYVEWDGGWMGNWEQRSIATESRFRYKEKYKKDLLLPDSLVNLWEGRPHLDTFRFLRDGWIVASATGDLADYHRLFEGLPHAGSLEETVRDWVNGLNKALGVAHPRIEHPLAHEEGATLYGASCLQLYNHITEQAQYKICANEACGQIFVRQQGRSGGQQRKSEGVKYCSSKCARAQAQRELRRRRAEPASDEVILEAQREESRTMTMLALAGARESQGTLPLGGLLRSKRFELGIDDRAVRRKAGVAAPVLVAIEADDFRRYEGQSVHMVRWITALANLYGMDHKELVARYTADELLRLTR
ncbi:helix-turn-helix domain-containing protein [Streptomyces sp. NPDC000878]